MSLEEMALVQELIRKNEDMRVILVGDDDQNIYAFRGSSSEYMKRLMDEHSFVQKELVQNYRSGKHLVAFSNRYATTIPQRLKTFQNEAAAAESGQVLIHQYKSKFLVVPLVEDVCAAQLQGSTCILTQTNEEAALAVGLLKRNRMPSRLIQSNDSFVLSDLFEVRAFMNMVLNPEATTISAETWEHAKKLFSRTYQNWTWAPHVLRMIKDFEEINPKTKYCSDLKAFIAESALSDFIYESSETILVSTFHKAKGREYDNIYILLQKGLDTTADFKRSLYVAMTRAKRNMVIHIYGTGLSIFADEEVQIVNQEQVYDAPDEISKTLTHEHVRLSFFSTIQNIISQLKTGDPLKVNSDGCTTLEGQFVLRFSNKFSDELKVLERKGYKPVSATVNFMVYWEDEGGKEAVIVLPEVVMKREG
jgi:ATP-dependent DNA helicase RecQ